MTRWRTAASAATLAGLVLAGCGGTGPDRDDADGAWTARPCTSLGLSGARPKAGSCVQDGRRTVVVERTATVRAGDLAVKLVDAAPRRGVDSSFAVTLEVDNGADAPRSFEVDARLGGGGQSVPLLPQSSAEVVGEPRRVVSEATSVNAAVPIRYDLRYDAARLGGAAPALVTQTLPRARPDQPQSVVFLLRPSAASGGRDDDVGSGLRTTASRLPGRVLDLPGARAIMPRGWRPDRPTTRRLARSGGGDAPLYATAWRRGGSAVSVVVTRSPGAGAALEEDPTAFLRTFAGRAARSFGAASKGASSRLLPATDLGGQTAGLLTADDGYRPPPGRATAAARLLITARDDRVYVITGVGPLLDDDAVRDVVTLIRRSWSWPAPIPDPGAAS